MAAIDNNLSELSEKLIKDLRCGYLASSHQLTVTWLDALQKLLLEAKVEDQHLTNLFNVMFDAQQRKDHLFFADIIEYELLPYLVKLGVFSVENKTS